jgi:hypothetical protein
MTTNYRAPVKGAIGKTVKIPTAQTDALTASVAAAQSAADAALAATNNATFSLSNYTTDDLAEGQWNLYFTDRRAQDAVGGILEDSANVTLRYVAGTSIIADLTELTDAGGGTLQKTAFDAYGRKTGTSAATSDDLPEGLANLYDAPITATALTALSYPNVVSVDGMGNAYYPDLSNPVDVERIAGVTLHAAAMGAPVKIVTSRDFYEGAWGWSPGRIYCASTGGALTQTPPTSPSAIVEVARAVSPTTIRVGIQPGIII